jgi:general secretion pathway protein G
MVLPAALRRKTLRERNLERDRIARNAERARRALGDPLTFRPGRNPFFLIAAIGVLLFAGALLIGRAGVAFRAPKARTREDIAQDEVRVLRIALERFRIDQGRYPTAQEGLQALVLNPGSVTNWQRHYISILKPDPWKRNYGYAVGTNGVEVSSGGPDRMVGTADDIVAGLPDAEDVNWPPEAR